MIKKDLQNFAISNWSKYYTTITELSKNDFGQSLVESDIQAYNFDDVVKDTFSGIDYPCSTDGILFDNNIISLIEFKSGFKQRITKNTFDVEKGTCKKANEVCSDYWKIFWENQDRKIDQLIDSIKMKSIESYIVLEKEFFPLCKILEKSQKINLCIVIDEDGVDGIEDALSDVAEIEPDTNNRLISIRKSLKRLMKRNDADGKEYYYDEINVYSATEYMLLQQKTI